MRQLFILFFVGWLVCSCAAIKTSPSVEGTYSGKTPASLEWIPSGNVTLTLHQNGTFDLLWRRRDGAEMERLDYVGKWKKTDGTHIMLDFDEVDLRIQLSTHAISYTDREIEIIGNNKIKLDGFVLKRK